MVPFVTSLIYVEEAIKLLSFTFHHFARGGKGKQLKIPLLSRFAPLGGMSPQEETLLLEACYQCAEAQKEKGRHLKNHPSPSGVAPPQQQAFTSGGKANFLHLWRHDGATVQLRKGSLSRGLEFKCLTLALQNHATWQNLYKLTQELGEFVLLWQVNLSLNKS